MQWTDDTTLPSRGLGLRPVGQSSEASELSLKLKTPKAQSEQRFFPLRPQKRTYHPILELLPPPALGERCHGRPRASPRSRASAAVFVLLAYRRPSSLEMLAKVAKRRIRDHLVERMC